MLRVEIRTDEIPKVFNEFRDIVGEKYWLNREKAIRKDIRENKFLEKYLVEENSIVLALSRCSRLLHRYNGIPEKEKMNRQLYPAIKFAAQVLSIVDASESLRRDGFVKRVRGAMNNPDDMRALELEINTATHFVRKGYKISWPELDGKGNFDLLVEIDNSVELEVECKSVSGNKGRKVHRRDALDFYKFLRPKLEPIIGNVRTGLSVVLSLPERLPTHLAEREKLAKQVVAQIYAGSSVENKNGVDISVNEFDAVVLDGLEPGAWTTDVREVVDRLTSTNNREALIHRNTSSGAFVFVIKSKKDDEMLESVFKTLKKSSDKQLTKSRPGYLVVGFDSVTGEMLDDVAKHDFDNVSHPTALRVHVSRFLSSESRDHVVGVAFLSKEGFESAGNNVVEASGKAYFFSKEESTFWNRVCGELFR